MTKKCSKCGETIGEESLFCPKCGNYVMSAGSKKSYPIKWIVITGICIVLLLFAKLLLSVLFYYKNLKLFLFPYIIKQLYLNEN